MGSRLHYTTKRKVYLVVICLFVAYVAIGIGIVVRGKAMMDSSAMLEVLHVSTRLALAGNQTDCTIADGFFLGNFCKAEYAVRGDICGCEVVKYSRTYTLLEKVLSIFYLTHAVNFVTPVSEFFGSKIIAYIPKYAYESKLLYGTILCSIKSPKLFLDSYQEHKINGMSPDIDNETIRHEKFYLGELGRKYTAIDVYVVVVDDDNDTVGRVVEVVSANLQ